MSCSIYRNVCGVFALDENFINLCGAINFSILLLKKWIASPFYKQSNDEYADWVFILSICPLGRLFHPR